jgi:hypothetical protein
MRLISNWQGEPSIRLMNTVIFDGMEKQGRAAYQKLIGESEAE